MRSTIWLPCFFENSFDKNKPIAIKNAAVIINLMITILHFAITYFYAEVVNISCLDKSNKSVSQNQRVVSLN